MRPLFVQASLRETAPLSDAASEWTKRLMQEDNDDDRNFDQLVPFKVSKMLSQGSVKNTVPKESRVPKLKQPLFAKRSLPDIHHTSQSILLTDGTVQNSPLEP